jgi:hypothetical protein
MREKIAEGYTQGPAAAASSGVSFFRFRGAQQGRNADAAPNVGIAVKEQTCVLLEQAAETVR